MTELRVKDNTASDRAKFASIAALTQRVADKTLEQLEKEGVFVFPEAIQNAKDITREQMVLQSVNDRYCTSNIMGFLGCGNERLSIESRFFTGEQDYFFQYLLEKVMDFPNILNLNTDSSMDTRVFHLLIFLFPRYLKVAMRKGPFKTYIQNQYNDPNIKGTIDVARHIRANTPFAGSIAYHQREFSYDNDLMKLIRHTIELIKTKSYGNRLLNRTKDEVTSVIKATSTYELHDRRRIINTNKKKPVRHAYFREYRELQRLCLMILQQENHKLGSGTRETYGLLFDGAWLWEEYINSLISEQFFHPMNKSGTDAQRLFAGNIGLIYPDFISRDTINRTIADAKYKPIDNIGNKDYLQVLAYMFRFDAKNGFFLYPESTERNGKALHLNQGSTYEKNVTPRDDVKLLKCGLRIPSEASSYNNFRVQMEKREQVFQENFIHCCTNEIKQSE